MWFVYILRSKKLKTPFIGACADLDEALAEHATGQHDETANIGPISCDCYIGMPDAKKAKALQKFLQSEEGQKLVKKWL